MARLRRGWWARRFGVGAAVGATALVLVGDPANQLVSAAAPSVLLPPEFRAWHNNRGTTGEESAGTQATRPDEHQRGVDNEDPSRARRKERKRSSAKIPSNPGRSSATEVDHEEQKNLRSGTTTPPHGAAPEAGGKINKAAPAREEQGSNHLSSAKRDKQLVRTRNKPPQRPNRTVSTTRPAATSVQPKSSKIADAHKKSPQNINGSKSRRISAAKNLPLARALLKSGRSDENQGDAGVVRHEESSLVRAMPAARADRKQKNRLEPKSLMQTGTGSDVEWTVTNLASRGRIQRLNSDISQERQSAEESDRECRAEQQSMQSEVMEMQNSLGEIMIQLADEEAKQGKAQGNKDAHQNNADPSSTSEASEKCNIAGVREKLRLAERQLDENRKEEKRLEAVCSAEKQHADDQTALLEKSSGSAGLISSGARRRHSTQDRYFSKRVRAKTKSGGMTEMTGRGRFRRRQHLLGFLRRKGSSFHYGRLHGRAKGFSGAGTGAELQASEEQQLHGKEHRINHHREQSVTTLPSPRRARHAEKTVENVVVLGENNMYNPSFVPTITDTTPKRSSNKSPLTRSATTATNDPWYQRLPHLAQGFTRLLETSGLYFLQTNGGRSEKEHQGRRRLHTIERRNEHEEKMNHDHTTSTCSDTILQDLRAAISQLEAETEDHRQAVAKGEEECKTEKSIENDEADEKREQVSANEQQIATAETKTQQLVNKRDTILDDLKSTAEGLKNSRKTCKKKAEESAALIEKLTEERNQCLQNAALTVAEQKPVPKEKLVIHDCEVSGWSDALKVEFCECTEADYRVKKTKHYPAKRQITVHPTATYGVACPVLTENRDCGNGPCLRPVDCKLSDWTPWDSCSVDCGGGVKSRSREVVREPEHGGADCVGVLSEQDQCNLQACEPATVDSAAASPDSSTSEPDAAAPAEPEPVAVVEPPQTPPTSPSSSKSAATPAPAGGKAGNAAARSRTAGGGGGRGGRAGGGGRGRGGGGGSAGGAIPCPLSTWSKYSTCSQSCMVQNSKVKPYQESRKTWIGFKTLLEQARETTATYAPFSGVLTPEAATKLPSFCKAVDWNGKQAVELKDCNEDNLCPKDVACAASVAENAGDVLLILDGTGKGESEIAAQRKIAKLFVQKLLNKRNPTVKTNLLQLDDADFASSEIAEQTPTPSEDDYNLEKQVRVGVLQFTKAGTSVLNGPEAVVTSDAENISSAFDTSNTTGGGANWTFYGTAPNQKDAPGSFAVTLAEEVLTHFYAVGFANATKDVGDTEKEKAAELPAMQAVPKLVENATKSVRAVETARRNLDNSNSGQESFAKLFSAEYGGSAISTASLFLQEKTVNNRRRHRLLYLLKNKLRLRQSHKSRRNKLNTVRRTNKQEMKWWSKQKHKTLSMMVSKMKNATSNTTEVVGANQTQKIKPSAAPAIEPPKVRRKTIILFLSEQPSGVAKLTKSLQQLKQKGFRVLILHKKHERPTAPFEADREDANLGTTVDGLHTSEFAHFDAGDAGMLNNVDDDYNAGLLPYLFLQQGTTSATSSKATATSASADLIFSRRTSAASSGFLCKSASFPCASNTAQVKSWEDALLKPQVVQQLVAGACPILV
ncbi:unnamed protein product [Amoebophrya sp. A120]|nr:unnamed protein product [Amoebophrya sp. A120]|eukprot:GSA120T00022838001.1